MPEPLGSVAVLAGWISRLFAAGLYVYTTYSLTADSEYSFAAVLYVYIMVYICFLYFLYCSIYTFMTVWLVFDTLCSLTADDLRLPHNAGSLYHMLIIC